MHTTTQKKENSILENCFEWVSMLIIALVSVVVIFALFFRVVTVSGDSMKNSLKDGDRVVLVTQFYHIERGDIIVATHNGHEPYIKRVIAVAGDTIDIDEESGLVLLNGETITEDYVLGGFTPTFDFEGPYTVREGEIFAMGDNRQVSYDCRDLGAFHEDDVAGEVALRLFPFNKIGLL